MLFRCRSSSAWIAAAISGSSTLKGFNQITGIAIMLSGLEEMQ